jgi:hypothetical protein
MEGTATEPSTTQESIATTMLALPAAATTLLLPT